MEETELNYYKRKFENHVATLQEAGAVKVIDFKEPDSIENRIRFIFEDDYCKLHITGSYGSLIATNYNNMVLEKFEEHYTDDAGYFRMKVDCHDKALEYYDATHIYEDLKQFITENEGWESLVGKVLDKDTSEYATEDEFLKSIDREQALKDFFNAEVEYSEETGITDETVTAITVMTDISEYDVYNERENLGKRSSGFIDIYLLAFKLAVKQLKEKGMWKC